MQCEIGEGNSCTSYRPPLHVARALGNTASYQAFTTFIWLCLHHQVHWLISILYFPWNNQRKECKTFNHGSWGRKGCLLREPTFWGFYKRTLLRCVASAVAPPSRPGCLDYEVICWLAWVQPPIHAYLCKGF
jgi:hypothetical protein